MKIYIGYDSQESIAYEVCRYSILKHNSTHEIIAIDKKLLDRSNDGSTEFTYTRFLVPYLNNYKGQALFCDCDFLWLSDPAEMLQLFDTRVNAVAVVKHAEYQPHTTTKMHGVPQSTYPRKNWSSLVWWNCAHPSHKALTPYTVNTAEPSYLHQFRWLVDAEMAALPIEYNWLVDYYTHGWPKGVHFTDGGPWFDEYKNCNYSDAWREYHEEYQNTK